MLTIPLPQVESPACKMFQPSLLPKGIVMPHNFRRALSFHWGSPDMSPVAYANDWGGPNINCRKSQALSDGFSLEVLRRSLLMFCM